MKRAVSGIFLLALGGCVPTTKPMVNTFVLSEHEAYRKSGNSSIEGQGFLRQQGGGVVRCSGEEVVLVPATPFFQEITEMWKQRAVPENFAQIKASYSPVARRTMCDADGKFKFERLPAGKWYVSTKVLWNIGGAPQGGTLQDEVMTGASGVTNVLLTDKNRL